MKKLLMIVTIGGFLAAGTSAMAMNAKCGDDKDKKCCKKGAKEGKACCKKNEDKKECATADGKKACCKKSEKKETAKPTDNSNQNK